MTDFEICAFTGHRQLDGDFDISLLNRVVEGLIRRGTKKFLCGMARGFDLAAAETVLKYKKDYGVSLTACIPYAGQVDSMGRTARERYADILEYCDEKIIFSQGYNRLCMHARDRYMVENCEVLVCYLRKESGGTFYTVN